MKINLAKRAFILQAVGVAPTATLKKPNKHNNKTMINVPPENQNEAMLNASEVLEMLAGHTANGRYRLCLLAGAEALQALTTVYYMGDTDQAKRNRTEAFTYAIRAEKHNSDQE